MNVYSKIIGELVGSNRIDEAIKQLSSLLSDSPKIKEVIIQSSKYSALKDEIRRGTISLEDSDITINKIRIGILELAEDIEDAIRSNEDCKQELASYLSNEQNKISLQQAHYGKGDNVGGDKIINN